MLALKECAPYGIKNRWAANRSPQWQELWYVHTVLKSKKMGQPPSREWRWRKAMEGFLEVVKSESWKINLQEPLTHVLKSNPHLKPINQIMRSCTHWTIKTHAILIAHRSYCGKIHFQSKDQKEQSVQQNTIKYTLILADEQSLKLVF